MSEEVAALKSDLAKKLSDLKSMVEHPKLFVAEHFSSLRHDIDLVTESSLQAAAIHQQAENEESGPPPPSETKDEHQDQLNAIREAMIQELAKHEKQLLSNAEKQVLDERKNALKEIEQNVETEFSDELSYEKLAVKILDEKFELEKRLLEQQTFMFFHSTKNPGILIHLPDVYLNMREINCIKTFLSTSKRNVMVPESLEILSKLMQEESSRLLVTRQTASALVIDDKLSNMAFLCLLIRGALHSGTKQHVFRLDRSFLDLNFKKNKLDPSGQDLKSALDGWIKSIDVDYRNSSPGGDDGRDPFEHATHVEELNLESKGLTKFTLAPKFAANIDRLNLSDNRLTEFDEGAFKSLKSVSVLELRNTFDLETPFSLNFLSSLKNLTAVEITLPAQFETKFLKKLEVDHVMLYDASTRDLNLPRTKLLKNFWNAFAETAKPDLWHLQLNGFEIQSRLVKMMPEIFMNYTKHVAKLNLDDNMISSLVPTCFESLHRLEELSVSHNLLTTLPANLFHHPRMLISVDFSSNAISQLPPQVFAAAPDLEYINLSDNELTHIKLGHFANSRQLKYLDLSKNPIQRIDANVFKNTPLLEQLSLDDCQLKSVDNDMFSGLNQLKYLNLSNNQIESICLKVQGVPVPIKANKTALSQKDLQLVKANLFTYFADLETFDLTGNCLDEFNVACLYNLRKLEELQLSKNKLAKLESHERCPYLYKKVILSGNRIERLDANFFRPFEALRTLDLENNVLLELSIGPDTFAAGVCLEALKLVGNKSITIQDEAWARLNKLEILRLESSNEDSNLPAMLSSNMTSLKELTIHKSSQSTFEALFSGKAEFLSLLKLVDFSHSSISSLGAVSLGTACPQLETLILSGNTIQLICSDWFAQMTKLTHLDLSANRIESIEDADAFVHCQALQHLKLGGNQIKSINPDAFASFTHLHSLDLANNCLEAAIDHGGLFSKLKSSLLMLNLSGNGLKKLNMAKVFRHMNKLRTVDLSNNQLDNSSINQDALERLGLHHELQELNLGGNQLTDINFIRNLSRVEKLNLSDNKITSIHREAPDGGASLFGRLVSLKHLDLSQNRLRISKDAFAKHGKRLEHIDISNNKPVEIIDELAEPANPSKKPRIASP